MSLLSSLSLTSFNARNVIQIRLEQDQFFLGVNAPAQTLRGTVTISLSSSLRIEAIDIRLIGRLRTLWVDHNPGLMTPHSRLQGVVRTIRDSHKQLDAGLNHKDILPAGTHRYFFELSLADDTAETVEGIPEASIGYYVEARVLRSRLRSNFVAFKKIRIVSTAYNTASELYGGLSIDNLWEGKAEYSIGISQASSALGSMLGVTMRIHPLLKGLQLGPIAVQLFETLRISNLIDAASFAKYHRDRKVAEWSLDTDGEQHWYEMMEDNSREGWMISVPIQLPTRLDQCAQDVNRLGIHVSHQFHITVRLKIADGHYSELRVRLPLRIFIPSNAVFDELGNLFSEAETACASSVDASNLAPPSYGEHTSDILC